MTTKISELDLVVLCGGKGTRLLPTTKQIPKALVPIKGKPIIDHVVGPYMEAGIRKLTLCVGYKGDQIRKHFDAPLAGAQISFSDSGEAASMLRRIYDVKDQIGKTALVVYCDTFTDLDVEKFAAFHHANGGGISIVTAKITSPYGITSIEDDGRVGLFEEKPVNDYYIGSFLIQRDTLNDVPDDLLDLPDGGGLVNFFQLMIENNQLFAYQHEGSSITFNTHDERSRAEKELDNFFTLDECE